MTRIKGVILSVEGTICPNGKLDRAIFSEVNKLINYFKSKGLDFVIHTNRQWTYNETSKLEDFLKEKRGEFSYICYADDKSIPPRPRAESIEYILNLKGWSSTETIYIGSTDDDMRTAVNGELLFLRATWWENKTDYGFEFASPKDIARFIDTFCLRSHLWCHEIHDGDFNFYALAPFSTMKEENTLYSQHARNAAKHGTGHPDFWIGAIVSSLYFSGVHKKIDYVSVYPGHKAGYGNPVMNEAISIFGKCFRKNYLFDLIIRHTDAIKSQTARNNKMAIDFLNQLNTIRLNYKPMRSATRRYVKSPLGPGKTVLLIDDITTKGYSLESGRAYIEQTGAKVILASWLKTINTDIDLLAPLGKFDPYIPHNFTSAKVLKQHSYRANIVDTLAPAEIKAMLEKYTNWDWP
ncbi:phosphoribosyl transferase [Cronobacter sakazakii]|nr:phosphoribosyl transferase [Cronobacter sakazakii]